MRTLLRQFCDALEASLHPLLEPIRRTTEVLSAAPAGWPVKKILPGLQDVRHHLSTLVEKVDGQQDFSAPRVEGLLNAFLEEKGLSAKELFMALRWMVTGKKATPPLHDTMAVLGRERVRTRIRAGLELLRAMQEKPADKPAEPGAAKAGKGPA